MESRKAFQLANGHKNAAMRRTKCGIQHRRRSKRGHTDLSVISLRHKRGGTEAPSPIDSFLVEKGEGIQGAYTE